MFHKILLNTIYILFLLIYLSGLWIVYSNRSQIISVYDDFKETIVESEDSVLDFENVAEMDEPVPLATEVEVNTSAPLVARENSPQSNLTVGGVIQSTNRHRAENGLPPLKENSILNAAAYQKVVDMFAKQYFAHDSPEGIGAGDLVKSEGYQFISVGENLALGNYLNDERLVQAWMDSPGHRENIVSTKYTEIGVSVVKGTYEGQSIWMGVQHFGRPLSDCRQADSSLKQKLESDTSQVKDMQKDLESRKKDLEQSDKNNHEEYNKKVDEYNELVEEYNELIADVKQMVADYNSQVERFNKCVGD